MLTASETSAAFMASAVGYLTGVPGVCVSTVGPGATNLTTGVGCAWLDRAPLLGDYLQRRNALARTAHSDAYRSSQAVRAADQGVVSLAVMATSARCSPRRSSLATHEPPGPVHLDLPEDVAQAAAHESRELAYGTSGRLPDLSSGTVAAISEALERCQAPVVDYRSVRLRAARRVRSLRQFVERQQIPFVTTLHGKGFLPESHPNCAGVIGRARRTDVKKFTDQADLIIAVGYDPIEINYEEWVSRGRRSSTSAVKRRSAATV